jgi:hypothetical protein
MFLEAITGLRASGWNSARNSGLPENDTSHNWLPQVILPLDTYTVASEIGFRLNTFENLQLAIFRVTVS